MNIPDKSSRRSSWNGAEVVVADIASKLSQHALFKDTDESFIERLAISMSTRIFKANDAIIRHGEMGKAMFFIYKGTVQVFSADGESVWATLSDGSFFGEIGVLFVKPRTATIRVAPDCVRCMVLMITKEKLDEILTDFQDVRRIITAEAEERLVLVKKLSGNGHALIGESPFEFADSFHVGILRETLSRVPLFREIPQSLLHELALVLQSKDVKSGTTLQVHGSPDDCMHFVLDGVVEVVEASVPTECGESTTCVLPQGSVFGDVTMVLAEKRLFGIRSITDCTLWVLFRESLFLILDKHPVIRDKLVKDARCRYNSWLNSLDLGISMITVLEMEKKNVALEMQSVEEGASVSGHTCNTPIVTSASGKHTEKGMHDDASTSATMMENCSLENQAVSMLKVSARKKRRASIAVWNADLAGGDDEIRKPEIPKNVLSEVDDSSYGSDLLSCTDKAQMLVLKSSKHLMHIFSFLDMFDRCRSASVCKVWCGVLSKSEMWETLDFCSINRKVTDRILDHYVSRFGSTARSLDMSNCFHVTDVGIKILIGKVSNIERLSLFSVWEATSFSMSPLLASMPRLRSLDLSNMRKITDDAMIMLSKNCPALRVLCVSYCKNLTGDSLSALIKGCPQLEELNLQRCTGIAKESFHCFREVAPTKLKNLVLSDLFLLDDKSILDMASSCPELRNINISFCGNIGEDSLLSLSKYCPLLEFINLNSCNKAASDMGVSNLTTNKDLCDNLKSINLRNCASITDKSLQLLDECFPNLFDVNVTNCKRISRETISMCRRLKAQHIVVSQNRNIRSRSISTPSCKLMAQAQRKMSPEKL